MSALIKPDPKLDLVLERVVDVPRELVWKAWTTPEHLKHWFCPKPWSVTECEIDLRRGGIFRTVMRSPQGEEFPNVLPGYRPSEKPFFTATLQLFEQGKGTRYVATALHRDPDGRKQHEDMGFHDGWGTVVDQMVAYIKNSM